MTSGWLGRVESSSRALVFIAHGVVLGLASALLLFSHPQVDDLARASSVRDLGFTGALKLEYEHIAGRWIGLGLSIGVSSLVDIRRHYPLLLGLIAAINLLALGMLVGSLLAPIARAGAALLSCALLALLWTAPIMPGETFYWFTGGIENQLAITLPIIPIAMLIRMRPRRVDAGRLARLAALATSALLVAGIHELYSSFFCAAVLLGLLDAARRRQQTTLEWMVTAVGAIGGFLIVYSAPGNDVRAHLSSSARSAKVVEMFWRFQGLPALRAWLLDVKLLAATPALVALLRAIPRRPAAGEGLPWRWLLPLLTLAVPIAGFSAYYWLLGGPLQPRTLAGLYLLWILGWFGTVVAWTPRPVPPGPAPVPARAALAVSHVVFAVALLAAPNTRAAWEDVLYRGPAYDHAMRSRDDFIERTIASGVTRVGVPPLPTMPSLFMRGDLVSDPKHYRNFHYAVFYRAKSLTLTMEN